MSSPFDETRLSGDSAGSASDIEDVIDTGASIFVFDADYEFEAPQWFDLSAEAAGLSPPNNDEDDAWFSVAHIKHEPPSKPSPMGLNSSPASEWPGSPHRPNLPSPARPVKLGSPMRVVASKERIAASTPPRPLGASKSSPGPARASPVAKSQKSPSRPPDRPLYSSPIAAKTPGASLLSPGTSLGSPRRVPTSPSAKPVPHVAVPPNGDSSLLLRQLLSGANAVAPSPPPTQLSSSYTSPAALPGSASAKQPPALDQTPPPLAALPTKTPPAPRQTFGQSPTLLNPSKASTVLSPPTTAILLAPPAQPRPTKLGGATRVVPGAEYPVGEEPELPADLEVPTPVVDHPRTEQQLNTSAAFRSSALRVPLADSPNEPAPEAPQAKTTAPKATASIGGARRIPNAQVVKRPVEPVAQTKVTQRKAKVQFTAANGAQPLQPKAKINAGVDPNIAKLLAEHNKKFKPKPAYEPRIHSTRDVKEVRIVFEAGETQGS